MSNVVGTSQLRVKNEQGPVSSRKSCFAFIAFAFKIKVSIILKIIQ